MVEQTPVKKAKKVWIDFPEFNDFIRGEIIKETEKEIIVLDPLYGKCKVQKEEGLSIVYF